MAAPINANWSDNDISDVNLNQTTYGQGTSFPATWPTNRFFWRTDTNILYKNTGTEGVPVWTAIDVRGEVGDMLYPLSITLGDYSGPASAVVSSTTVSQFSDDFSGADNWVDNDSAKIGVNTTTDVLDFINELDSTNDACVYDLGAGNVSDTSWELRFKLQFTTLTASANNSFWIGISNSTQTTSAGDAQDAILIHFEYLATLKRYGGRDTDGTAPNAANPESPVNWTPSTGTPYYVQILRTSTTTYTVEIFTNSDYATGSLGQASCVCVSTTSGLRYIKIMNRNNVTEGGEFNGFIDDVVFNPTGAAQAIDNKTVTSWTSVSENNPNIYVDLTSARDIASVAVNLNRTATTETQIKVRISTDTTFTDGETVRLINISDFTDDTWRYLVVNRLSADARYVQFYGVSNSVVLSINEIKVNYSPTTTDWNRKHYHRKLSTTATDNSLDSN